MEYTNRFDISSIKNKESWASIAADTIIDAHPDTDIYTTAAGISPSGVVHFGNFRDIVTAHLVREALKEKGKSARLIFSWDNFDRYRKVPSGVPELFSEHIGKPLSKIPDPVGSCHTSYAEHFQAPFVEAMEKLGIEIEYRNQTELHESGVYDDAIFHALKERKKIADILLSFMTDKAKGEKGINSNEYKEKYYPIAVYSRFTGKDITKILHYDGDTSVTYLCVETGKEDTVDLSKDHIAKLAWKPDWAMRWKYENVHFEPGGHDHASPGGSYDASSVITREIFNYVAPVFIEYKFVGIQGLGSKMSGSKGNAVSPLELLEIYEPDVLRWLYFRKSPDQSFELAFNTEIYRQYDEYDSEHTEKKSIPFRQAVGFGQIVQWQEDKLQVILNELELSYSKDSIKKRLPLARNWLTKYNPSEMVALNETVNASFAETLNDAQVQQIRTLHDELLRRENPTVQELEKLVYSIPKSPDLDEAQLKKEQRAFFKNVYNLLIGRDAGPRLGTFLWALEKNKALPLLNITGK
ncbi:lysine--tRNA ligase [Candidatus Kaiserbacteria bacterium CG10_big_fil_rev_8_21_14_0_10_45_20]|uniref:Lysine--tRNA ligase n=1 Tax=Candidatus Kaiserbacteria bacterium CG10_big_fil_rev_8_21_14_0_10_45_20 TaxID=1974607 RepID=A0A2H0UG66_9BACT|nr:MAG: lysine--tRNA ligase [Candidatus Kaiserbacteria bacterium CG10_big_fil_rev_8_21_14_0_10_45_20]